MWHQTYYSFYLLLIARLLTERKNSQSFLRDIFINFVEIKMKYADLNNYLNIIYFKPFKNLLRIVLAGKKISIKLRSVIFMAIKPVSGVVEVLLLARADDNSIQLFAVPHICLNKRMYHYFRSEHILIHFMDDFYLYNWLQNRTRKCYFIKLNI